jgi:hypothetical protein
MTTCMTSSWWGRLAACGGLPTRRFLMTERLCDAH